MGRASLLPAQTAEAGDIAAPFGTTDSDEFIADFSNIGPEIDVTGPGVGVVSTVPGGYAVMSGTSMACPAVTGAAARLLSANSSVLSMARNAARSEAIIELVYSKCKPRGFGPNYEGHGLPIA